MRLPEDPTHRRAIELAEAGDYSQALDLMNQRLTQAPEDAEALNDAAVLLHCLNRTEEGIEHLVKAHQLDPDSTEIVWNLVESYLAEAEVDKAMELLVTMETRGVLGFDVLNRAANICINNDQLTQARDLLQWSLRLQPNQEILHPIIEVLDHKIREGQTSTVS